MGIFRQLTGRNSEHFDLESSTMKPKVEVTEPLETLQPANLQNGEVRHQNGSCFSLKSISSVKLDTSNERWCKSANGSTRSGQYGYVKQKIFNINDQIQPLQKFRPVFEEHNFLVPVEQCKPCAKKLKMIERNQSLIHMRGNTARKVRLSSPHKYYMEKNVLFYFQHPWFRIFVCSSVCLMNIFQYREDPISYSVKGKFLYQGV